MITVHMMGNLGNQLFIYAMARSLQLEQNDNLTIDLSGLKRRYYCANYKLDDFNLPDDINYNISMLGFWRRNYYLLTSRIFHLQSYICNHYREDRLMPRTMLRRWFNRGCYYNNDRPYYEYPNSDKQFKYIYGYFQSEKYFIKHKEVIVRELQVKKPISESDAVLIEKMQSENSVAVSIRANMAPENPNVKDNLMLGMIDKDFYYRGMKEIASRVENPVFYIFADSIDIVKAEYNFPYPVIYVSPEDSSTGLRLMNNCKHYVISNSTFSWWGAYLSTNKNKIVVMPEIYDRFPPKRDDIYFGNPIKLSVTFLTE